MHRERDLGNIYVSIIFFEYLWKKLKLWKIKVTSVWKNNVFLGRYIYFQKLVEYLDNYKILVRHSEILSSVHFIVNVVTMKLLYNKNKYL